MKPFAVIVFASDQSVSAVPSSWISANSLQCAWPIKYPPNFKKIIRDQNSLPGSDWMLLDCEIKKRYDLYEVADSKTKKYLKDDAEASSSELESTPKPSRTKRGKESLSLSEINRNVFIEPSTSAHKDFRVPKGRPSCIEPNLEGGEPNAAVSGVPTDTPTSAFLPPPLFIETLPEGNQFPPDDFFSNNENPLLFSNNTGGDERFSITVVDQSLREEIGNLRTELRQFQAVVLGKLEEIARDNKETRGLLQTVLSSQHADQSASSSVHLVFQLTPLQTENDFTKLEEELKSNDESCNKLIGYLKRGGGSSLSDNVYNILRSLFTEDMSRKVRLTSKSKKLSFGESKLADCVKEAVHQSLRTDNSIATDKQINHYIGSWFRQRGYIRHVKQLQGGVQMDEEKADQQDGVTNSTESQGGRAEQHSSATDGNGSCSNVN